MTPEGCFAGDDGPDAMHIWQRYWWSQPPGRAAIITSNPVFLDPSSPVVTVNIAPEMLGEGLRTFAQL